MARRKFAYLVSDYLESIVGEEPPFWRLKEWKNHCARVREIGLELAVLDDEEVYKKLLEDYHIEESKAIAFIEESSEFRRMYKRMQKFNRMIGGRY